jgi:hypothetical protein
MAHRLSWPSLSGRNLLDYGCGVRFARTIINLGIDVGRYVGIDVKRDAVDWLRANIVDPRFTFEHIDAWNEMYNPNGLRREWWPQLEWIKGIHFDAICLFSVITHQKPEPARTVFSLLHHFGSPSSHLYFTAFLDQNIATDAEGEPGRPSLKSTYNPDYLKQIVADSCWQVVRAYDESNIQQHTFIADWR